MNKQELFESIEVGSDCEECSNILIIRDPFMTGDSPTEIECGGSVDDCFKLDELMENEL